jgi:hypothetical protein
VEQDVEHGGGSGRTHSSGWGKKPAAEEEKNPAGEEDKKSSSEGVDIHISIEGKEQV